MDYNVASKYAAYIVDGIAFAILCYSLYKIITLPFDKGKKEKNLEKMVKGE